MNFCLLILGASVGCRFAEKTVKEIANNSLHSLIATTILVILGLIAAYMATFFIDTNICMLLSYNYRKGISGDALGDTLGDTPGDTPGYTPHFISSL